MAKIYRVNLTDLEREELEGIIKRSKSEAVRTKRSYILLAADEHGDKKWKDDQISNAYGLSIRTIGRLRKRFVEHGIETALYGKKQEITREKIFDGRVESQLIALRCGEVPEGQSGWTLRLLADKMVELEYVESISHETVRQMLKKTPLSRGE